MCVGGCIVSTSSKYMWRFTIQVKSNAVNAKLFTSVRRIQGLKKESRDSDLKAVSHGHFFPVTSCNATPFATYRRKQDILLNEMSKETMENSRKFPATGIDADYCLQIIIAGNTLLLAAAGL